MTTSIAESLLQAARALRKAGVADARREAGDLLSFVIARDRTSLISHAEDILNPEQINRFQQLVDRRSLGEPLQYITRKQDFFGREFNVSPAVLIPRPETELLVECALRVMKDFDSPTFCDVGTGSGCITVTVLCERTDSRATALDISPAALDVAKTNAFDHGVTERVTFKISDCFAALESNDQFDLVLSNPPYIPAAVIPTLQREVRDYEPLMALAAGSDGLDVVRRLLLETPARLRSGGYLIMEIGFDQSGMVKQLVDNSVWELVEIKPDLQGIPRIVLLRKL